MVIASAGAAKLRAVDSTCQKSPRGISFKGFRTFKRNRNSSATGQFNINGSFKGLRLSSRSGVNYCRY